MYCTYISLYLPLPMIKRRNDEEEAFLDSLPVDRVAIVAAAGTAAIVPHFLDRGCQRYKAPKEKSASPMPGRRHMESLSRKAFHPILVRRLHRITEDFKQDSDFNLTMQQQTKCKNT